MLYNKTKGKLLTEKVSFARSFFGRSIGLMFRFKFDGALIFENVGSATFHSFFCFFPILLVCVEKNRVVRVITLHPWTTVRVAADAVIELDAREDWDISPGDELVWHEA